MNSSERERKEDAEEPKTRAADKATRAWLGPSARRLRAPNAHVSPRAEGVIAFPFPSPDSSCFPPFSSSVSPGESNSYLSPNLAASCRARAASSAAADVRAAGPGRRRRPTAGAQPRGVNYNI